MKRAILPTKTAPEVIPISFDFSSSLIGNDALTGTPTFTVSAYLGADPSTFTMLFGAATRNGNVATQQIWAGIEGNTYVIKCTANTIAGAFLVMEGYLTVVQALAT